VSAGGGGAGLGGGDVTEGVELGTFDGGERELQRLGRGDLTLSEGVDEGAGVARPGLVGHFRRLRHRDEHPTAASA
jgi:hypothetical protein